MLKPQVQGIQQTPFPSLPQRFVSAPNGRTLSPATPASTPSMRLPLRRGSRQANGKRSSRGLVIVSCASPAGAAATVTAAGVEKYNVTATISVLTSVEGLLSNIGIGSRLDQISDMLGKSIQIELVSKELNAGNGKEKETIKAWARVGRKEEGVQKYEAKFEVDAGFGEVGAVLITNEHHSEMHFKEIVLGGFPNGDVHITCNSWVHAKKDNPEKTVFFTDKEEE